MLQFCHIRKSAREGKESALRAREEPFPAPQTRSGEDSKKHSGGNAGTSRKLCVRAARAQGARKTRLTFRRDVIFEISQ